MKRPGLKQLCIYNIHVFFDFFSVLYQTLLSKELGHIDRIKLILYVIYNFLMHLFRDCDEVKDFWSQAINEANWSRFFSLGLNAWLEWNFQDHYVGSQIHGEWPIFFGVFMWSLWKDRNSLVFSKKTDLRENLFILLKVRWSLSTYNG